MLTSCDRKTQKPSDFYILPMCLSMSILCLCLCVCLYLDNKWNGSEGSPLQFRIDAISEAIEDEGEPIALIEFILELHPVQSESMQEALHTVHTQQNPKRRPC